MLITPEAAALENEDRIKEKKPLIGVGIYYPMLRNQWKLDGVSVLSEDETNLLMNHVVMAHFEFNANVVSNTRFGLDGIETHKLLLVIEEPAVGGIADIVKKLSELDKPFDIKLANLDGDTTKLKTTTYFGCRVKKYTYTLDYGVSQTCSFPVTFSVEAVSYR